MRRVPSLRGAMTRRHDSGHFPAVRLIAPALVTSIALIVLVAGNWIPVERAHRASDRRAELIRGVGTIRYLDEALTGSARLAVVTGSGQEADRYARLAQQFEQVVAATERAAGDPVVTKAIKASAPAADKLFALEEEAFELVAAGRRREAAAVIEGSEYAAQKRIYAQGLNRMIQAVETVARREEQRISRTGEIALGAGLLALVTVLLALRAVARILRRWSVERAQAQERLSSILDAAGEGIYGLDRDGITTFVNPAAAALTGHTADELLGESSHAVIHHHHADGRPYPREECPVLAAIRDGRARRVTDEVYWRKDGSCFPVEYTATPLIQEREVVGAVVVFSDISERREVDRLKNEFTSIVSHELRTPLTSIRGSLGLLASGALGPLPDKGQRMVDIAVQNTDRLVRLINDILDLERIESGEVTMEVRACDAAELVEQAVAVMEGLASRAGVRLESAAQPVEFVADPDRVAQTLTNLISNAIKFSPAGTVVAVEVERRDGEALFRVRDQGRGIPKDKLESVFERFEQVDASDAREKGGTGLGLSICRRIVEQHGGRIWVESTVGEGSTFSFALPAIKVGTRPDVDVSGPAVADGPLVLVCDDDASVREVLAETLRLNGYRTMLAAGGDEAVQLAREQRPDVVLLDLLMPGLDGRATARLLHEIPSLAAVPIVVVSVVERPIAGARAPEASEWIVKPVDEPSLLRALERATGQEERPPRVLVLEDDRDLANVLVAGLERSGCAAAQAKTAGQALELARRLDPDLLVLDLGLPDTDGIDVVELIRGDERLRSVPIIVYTARDIVGEDLERLRRGGVREVLTKGRVGPEDLERRVTELLGSVIGSRDGARG